MAFKRERRFLYSYIDGIYALRRELLAAIVVLLAIVFLFSGLVYLVENPVQPRTFDSYWTSLYWGVITVTTVGYGDMAPITPVGRFLSALFSLIGIFYLLMTISVLATAYVQATSPSELEITCPNCGERSVGKPGEKADQPRAQLR